MNADEKRKNIIDLLPSDDPDQTTQRVVDDAVERSSAKDRAERLLRTKKAKPIKEVPHAATSVVEMLPTKPSESPAVQQAVEVLQSKAKATPRSQATTRESVVRLMDSLNIDLDLQLTKNDTATLLSCLLTANETQLNALYDNRRIPITIKTVIKRLLDDSRTGNMETIERMWDRLFGKNPMTESVSTQANGASGGTSIIPNGPVSRETYIFIKEQLLGS